MYNLSANATPAERLAWLKENKRVILRCKHWRDIPEYVAEMKKTNAEIRKLEPQVKKAQALPPCCVADCDKPVVAEGGNLCVKHLVEWAAEQKNLIDRLQEERDAYHIRLEAACAELHFAGIRAGEPIEQTALCAGIRQLRAERDALKMIANGAQRDLVDCIVGHEQTSVHAAFGEETPLGEQYGGE